VVAVEVGDVVGVEAGLELEHAQDTKNGSAIARLTTNQA
jgi:hypothetical protein